MEIKDLIKKLLSEINAISKTETVVGEPLQVGRSKLIPISKLSIGFGVGGVSSNAQGGSEASGGGEGQIGGAGGGLRVEPMAFIAVDPEGRAQLLCLDEPEATVIDKLLHVAPELVDKLMARVRGEPAIEAAEDTAATDTKNG